MLRALSAATKQVSKAFAVLQGTFTGAGCLMSKICVGCSVMQPPGLVFKKY